MEIEMARPPLTAEEEIQQVLAEIGYPNCRVTEEVALNFRYPGEGKEDTLWTAWYPRPYTATGEDTDELIRHRITNATKNGQVVRVVRRLVITTDEIEEGV